MHKKLLRHESKEHTVISELNHHLVAPVVKDHSPLGNSLSLLSFA